MRRPIIEDQRFVAGVRDERYAVLVMPDAILEACDAVQRTLRVSLAALDVVYPRAHLTLASFAKGTELREAQATIDRWARRASPLDVRLEGVDVFGPPHQVVYALVRKSRDLERAYADLAQERAARGLEAVGGEAGNIALADWTPHLSLAYCGRLDDPGWRAALAAARGARLPGIDATAREVELVTYDTTGERLIGSFPLRATTAG